MPRPRDNLSMSPSDRDQVESLLKVAPIAHRKLVVSHDGASLVHRGSWMWMVGVQTIAVATVTPIVFATFAFIFWGAGKIPTTPAIVLACAGVTLGAALAVLTWRVRARMWNVTRFSPPILNLSLNEGVKRAIVSPPSSWTASVSNVASIELWWGTSVDDRSTQKALHPFALAVLIQKSGDVLPVVASTAMTGRSSLSPPLKRFCLRHGVVFTSERLPKALSPRTGIVGSVHMKSMFG